MRRSALQTYSQKVFSLCLAATLVIALATPSLNAQVSNADDLVYPPMPTVDVPSPERVTLENGMTLMLLEDHELPLVEARAMIRTGDRWEPADHVGLASLVGQVLRSGGTTSMAADELDDLLEDRAAVIETFIGSESGSATMSSLKGDFPEMLGVLADILRNPAFEEDKLEVAKTQAASGISRQNDDASGIAWREFNQLIYGEDSPYARDTTYETLDNIDRQDLLDWHAKYFHPQNIILGLVGDFDSKDAVALVKKVFGDWAQGPDLQAPEISIKAPQPGVFHVEKSDVTQSNIRIGHLGIEHSNPDYFAVELMNEVFGGSFAARLFSNVRSKKGLAYNVGGRVGSSWDHKSTFFMSMSTKTETTAAGIDALLEEARKMASEPPTDEEVAKARSSILNSFVFRADSTREILSQQMTYEYYGFPLDWLQRYRQGIESATTAQVQKVAEKYIHPDQVVILVVGPSEGTDRPLSDFGTVQNIDIAIPEPAGEAVEKTAEGVAKAAELLDKVEGALGGADKVASITSMVIDSSATMHTPQGSMQVQSKGYLSLPNKMRNELTLPFGTMVQGLSGDGSGFMTMAQGTQPMPESQVKQLQGAMLRYAIVLIQRRGDEGFEAVALGAADLNGTNVERVHVALEGHEQVVSIDPTTGDIVGFEFRGNGFTGAPGDLQQVYSDFRDVDGVRLPFASKTTFDGEIMFEGVNNSVKLNEPLDDTLFVKPE